MSKCEPTRVGSRHVPTKPRTGTCPTVSSVMTRVHFVCSEPWLVECTWGLAATVINRIGKGSKCTCMCGGRGMQKQWLFSNSQKLQATIIPPEGQQQVCICVCAIHLAKWTSSSGPFLHLYITMSCTPGNTLNATTIVLHTCTLICSLSVPTLGVRRKLVLWSVCWWDSVHYQVKYSLLLFLFHLWVSI